MDPPERPIKPMDQFQTNSPPPGCCYPAPSGFPMPVMDQAAAKTQRITPPVQTFHQGSSSLNFYNNSGQTYTYGNNQPVTNYNGKLMASKQIHSRQSQTIAEDDMYINKMLHIQKFLSSQEQDRPEAELDTQVVDNDTIESPNLLPEEFADHPTNQYSSLSPNQFQKKISNKAPQYLQINTGLKANNLAEHTQRIPPCTSTNRPTQYDYSVNGLFPPNKLHGLINRQKMMLKPMPQLGFRPINTNQTNNRCRLPPYHVDRLIHQRMLRPLQILRPLTYTHRPSHQFVNSRGTFNLPMHNQTEQFTSYRIPNNMNQMNCGRLTSESNEEETVAQILMNMSIKSSKSRAECLNNGELINKTNPSILTNVQIDNRNFINKTKHKPKSLLKNGSTMTSKINQRTGDKKLVEFDGLISQFSNLMNTYSSYMVNKYPLQDYIKRKQNQEGVSKSINLSEIKENIGAIMEKMKINESVTTERNEEINVRAVHSVNPTDNNSENSTNFKRNKPVDFKNLDESCKESKPTAIPEISNANALKNVNNSKAVFMSISKDMPSLDESFQDSSLNISCDERNLIIDEDTGCEEPIEPHEVPRDQPDVILGSCGTKITYEQYNQIQWKDINSATRSLLRTFFSRDTLASHSLSGKPSPAFGDKPIKKALNPNIIRDITEYISKKFNVGAKQIRQVITTKCADENKLKRQRDSASFYSVKKRRTSDSFY